MTNGIFFTKLFPLIFVMVASFPGMAPAQKSCEDILSDPARLAALKVQIGPAIEKFVGAISEIPIEVMTGKQIPNWQDFENIDRALTILRQRKKQFAAQPEVLQEFELLAGELRKELSSRNYLRKLMTATLAGPETPAKAYAPTDYEMKLAFQQMLGRINKELPRELRLPVSRLPWDQRRHQINAMARKIYLENFVPGFEKLFWTSGHKDYVAYEEKIRSTDDPHIKKALELIDKDQIQAVIRRPREARFWVPKTGFQNQFVTGTSRGLMALDGRNRAETKMYHFGQVTEYANLDAEVKPKYGTMRADPKSGVQSNLSDSSHYGEDIYILKSKTVADRLSYYVSDSLGKGLTPESNPNWLSNFIPWSRRLLMVPFMVEGLKSNSMNNGIISTDQQILKDLNFFYSVYWEIQVLGSVGLKEVEGFEFLKEPPSGDFLRELRKNNIKIFDGRTQPATEWKELVSP